MMVMGCDGKAHTSLYKNTNCESFCITHLKLFFLSVRVRLADLAKERLYEETHALNYKEVLLILLQQLPQLPCMGDTSFLDPCVLIGRAHFQHAFKIKAWNASM